MKIVKESLLLNDLKSTLDAVEDVMLVQRMENEPIIMMTLEEYNELKKQIYMKDN